MFSDLGVLGRRSRRHELWEDRCLRIWEDGRWSGNGNENGNGRKKGVYTRDWGCCQRCCCERCVIGVESVIE
jgi:hypothetical protein